MQLICDDAESVNEILAVKVMALLKKFLHYCCYGSADGGFSPTSTTMTSFESNHSNPYCFDNVMQSLYSYDPISIEMLVFIFIEYFINRFVK